MYELNLSTTRTNKKTQIMIVAASEYSNISIPAHVLGLADRGEIAEGKRADMVLVDNADPQNPKVAGTIIAGQLVYGAKPIIGSPF